MGIRDEAVYEAEHSISCLRRLAVATALVKSSWDASQVEGLVATSPVHRRRGEHCHVHNSRRSGRLGLRYFRTSWDASQVEGLVATSLMQGGSALLAAALIQLYGRDPFGRTALRWQDDYPAGYPAIHMRGSCTGISIIAGATHTGLPRPRAC